MSKNTTNYELADRAAIWIWLSYIPLIYVTTKVALPSLEVNELTLGVAIAGQFIYTYLGKRLLVLLLKDS